VFLAYLAIITTTIPVSKVVLHLITLTVALQLVDLVLVRAELVIIKLHACPALKDFGMEVAAQIFVHLATLVIQLIQIVQLVHLLV